MHQITIAVNNHKSNICKENQQTMKLQTLDKNVSATSSATLTADKPNSIIISPTSSPPDFDFSIPCRYFKSSFARSLSLNNANNHHNFGSKSLDFNVNNMAYNAGINQQQHIKNDCPPLPQRLIRAGTPAAASAAILVEGNDNKSNSNNKKLTDNNCNGKNEVNDECCCNETTTSQPPALPARRPMPTTTAAEIDKLLIQQQQQKSAQHLLTQLRNSVATGANSSSAAHKNPRQTFNNIKQQHYCYNNIARSVQYNNNSGDIIGSDNIRRNICPQDHMEQDYTSCDDDEQHQPHELLKPTVISRGKPVQKAPQQHRASTSFEIHENPAMNVEAVILQNEVDTLQWQLKQVETSCEMYRAVMEEVARFFERYQNQKEQQRQQNRSNNHCNMEQMSRSKSLYHVATGDDGTDTAGSGEVGIDINGASLYEKKFLKDKELAATNMRSRSSTNLIDLKNLKIAHGDKCDGQAYEIAPSNSYTTFKDFTWRRSPKKLKDSRPNTPADEMEEKLIQEAFRLSRTINNLLNTSTRQPDLRHHARNSLIKGSAQLSKTPTASMLTLHAPLHNSTAVSLTNGVNGNCASSIHGNIKGHALANTADILFLRSANMRESRLSLRSSTDSSVHSSTSLSAASSSSKTETDEEIASFNSSSPQLIADIAVIENKQMQQHQQHQQQQQLTEDESGFSSISSFQDVGVPLSSTILSHVGRQLCDGKQNNASSSYEANTLQEFNAESRNSTLKALMSNATTSTSATLHPNNVLGVPLRTHSAENSKTYRNATKLQRFSTLSNEDSATVLWV